MKARCKSEESLKQLIQHARGYEDQGKTNGLIWTEFAQADDDPLTVYAVIHFKDREKYYANAARPETDQWYRKMVGYLEAEPTWFDVKYLDLVGRVPESQVTAATP